MHIHVVMYMYGIWQPAQQEYAPTIKYINGIQAYMMLWNAMNTHVDSLIHMVWQKFVIYPNVFLIQSEPFDSGHKVEGDQIYECVRYRVISHALVFISSHQPYLDL